VLSAILWVLRTGAPWRDLPERFGPWSTAWSRFRRWTAVGVWQRVLAALQRDADRDGRLDWTTHYVDGTVIRAHQHAAGAVGGQEHEALGRSRGGFSTKVHLRAEGGGKPLVLVLSGGERHESRYVAALLAGGRVRRGGRGRPRGSSATKVTAIRPCAGSSRDGTSAQSSHAVATSGPTTGVTRRSTGTHTARATWWSGSSTA
jgi:transposase